MKMRALLGFGTIVASLVAAGCGSDDGAADTWTITSPAFADGAALPASATCDGRAFGEGSSPELNWTAGPEGTKSYAIVFKDLTILAANDPASLDHAYHWAIWDIPAGTHKLSASLGSSEFLADVGNARQWSSVHPYGYLGSCPNPIPGGAAAPVTDNYSFTLYAIGVPILAYPADPVAGDNYVRPLDDYLLTANIGKIELHAKSGAVATDFTPPDPPPGPSARP